MHVHVHASDQQLTVSTRDVHGSLSDHLVQFEGRARAANGSCSNHGNSNHGDMSLL